MTLGKAVERLRLERGLNQNEFARRAGWNDPSRVSKLEHDRFPEPRASTIADIVRALDVSADYLFMEAGWLPADYQPGELDFGERRLITAVRQIPTPSVRQRTLEMLTWVAETGRDADLARRPALKLVAEDREQYEEES